MNGNRIGVIKDISRFGCCLECEGDLDLRETRYLILHFPQKEIDILARSVWKNLVTGRDKLLQSFGMVTCLVGEDNWSFVDQLPLARGNL